MNLHKAAITLIGLFLFPMAQALAEEDLYSDNRSSPETLIASYFNALDRHEFARAWSYWSEGALGNNFEDYVEGFTEVESYRFKLGTIVSEGAAGSLYYQVPIVLAYGFEDGADEVWNGCFVLKLVQPAIQSPPFRPLRIENGSLLPIENEAFSDAAPGVCED